MEPVVEAWNKQLYRNRIDNGQTPLISPEDLTIIRFTDKIHEIVDTISASYDRWQRDIHSHIQIVR